MPIWRRGGGGAGGRVSSGHGCAPPPHRVEGLEDVRARERLRELLAARARARVVQLAERALDKRVCHVDDDLARDVAEGGGEAADALGRRRELRREGEDDDRGRCDASSCGRRDDAPPLGGRGTGLRDRSDRLLIARVAGAAKRGVSTQKDGSIDFIICHPPNGHGVALGGELCEAVRDRFRLKTTWILWRGENAATHFQQASCRRHQSHRRLQY